MLQLASSYIGLPQQPPADRIEFERYCLANGLAMHMASGFYISLPWLKRMLNNIEAYLTRVFEHTLGASPIEFNAMQAASFFEESGRMALFGGEVFHVTDRKERRYILSPTNEEIMAHIFRRIFAPSLKGRMSFFDIGKKFRDEVGGGSISRTREFRMFELYTIHGDASDVMPWGATVMDEMLKALRALECEPVLSESKESITSRFSGFRSLDLNVRSRLRTGYEDPSGESLLQLAKWTPLGDTYFKDSSRFMSCLGLGPMRIVIHLFERLSANGRYQAGMPIRWPAAIRPFDCAIVIPEKGSRFTADSPRLTELADAISSDRVLLDDRIGHSFQGRVRQLFELGLETVITLSGDSANPYRLWGGPKDGEILDLPGTIRLMAESNRVV